MTCYGGREKVGRGLPRTRSRFRLFSAVTDFLWLYHLRLPANACMEVLHAFEVRRRGGGMDRERERERVSNELGNVRVQAACALSSCLSLSLPLS
jgi:hypothetical protein